MCVAYVLCVVLTQIGHCNILDFARCSTIKSNIISITSICSASIVLGKQWCSVFLTICVTMVALRTNNFCPTNAANSETDFQLLVLASIFISLFTFQLSNSFT